MRQVVICNHKDQSENVRKHGKRARLRDTQHRIFFVGEARHQIPYRNEAGIELGDYHQRVNYEFEKGIVY